MDRDQLIDHCEKDNVEDIKNLLINGMSPSIFLYDVFHTPFICIASKYGKLDIVKLLILWGASPNEKCLNRKTPLFYACEKGHIDVVSFLLERGAKINYENNNGETALTTACENGHLEVFNFLVEKGANMDIKGMYHGRNLLICSCYGNNIEIVKTILEKGIDDVNNPDSDFEKTPLLIASMYDNIDIIKLLIDYGADIYKKDCIGRSCLMYSCWYDKLENVKLFLSLGLDINEREIYCEEFHEGREPWYPLLMACHNKENTLETAKFLLDNGADRTNLSFLNYLSEDKRKELEEYINSFGCNIKPVKR